jgi:hypothetical protein
MFRPEWYLQGCHKVLFCATRTLCDLCINDAHPKCQVLYIPGPLPISVQTPAITCKVKFSKNCKAVSRLWNRGVLWNIKVNAKRKTQVVYFSRGHGLTDYLTVKRRNIPFVIRVKCFGVKPLVAGLNRDSKYKRSKPKP